MSETKVLAIDLVKLDAELQGREAIDPDHVADLRGAWRANGNGVPPLKVFFDGTTYWLSDGYHRWHAAKEEKRGSVPCLIVQGTKREAWLDALKANQGHGLRRSNADKRKLVRAALNDPELVKWSDGKIAEHIGVTQAFVSSLRREVKSVLTPTKGNGKPKVEKRVGRDGKVYEVQKKEKPAPVKQYKDDFDTTKLDKELAKTKKNGSVKPQWNDQQVIDAIGQFAKQIDAAYSGFLSLLEECHANVGGSTADFDRAKRACLHGKAKSHELLDGVTKGFRAWRPAK